MEPATPSRLYATLVGAALVAFGIIGFFYEASFATGDDLASDELFGLFAVNGWHNVFNIVLGLVGLAMAGTATAARAFSLGAGALFVLIAVWGFLEAEEGFAALLDLLPVNTEANFAHLLLGATGIGAGLSSGSGGDAAEQKT